MPTIQGDQLYKTRGEIVTSFISAWNNRIPDARTDADSVARLLFEVIAQELSGNYLSAQLLFDDIWPQTADAVSLLRFGTEFNYPIEGGTVSSGSLRIEGEAGTFVPAGSQFAAVLIQSEPYLFATTESGTIPAPGVSDPLTATEGAAGNVTGTIEYATSFVTLEGETMIGSPSDPLVVTSKQINLSVIALGGPGVLGRKIYRNDSGAGFKLLVLIPDNSTTIYTDNTLTSGLTASPPTESTAERVTLGAESIDVGRRFNVAPQTITNVSNAPGGIVGVTNISAFTGGTEGQDFEDYRQGLMEFIGNPQSGSPGDLKSWAEGVDGVEEASVFVNDNLGTPMNGHNTIRITGTGGVIPSAEVVAATQLALDTEDLANITNHVTTFTPNTINTTVNATPHPDYSLAEITPQIQEAVANYINFIGVGQTVYRAGLVDAVFGLPGVVNVTVTTPASDVTSTAVQKPVSNVVTVNAL